MTRSISIPSEHSVIDKIMELVHTNPFHKNKLSSNKDIRSDGSSSYPTECRDADSTHDLSSQEENNQFKRTDSTSALVSSFAGTSSSQLSNNLEHKNNHIDNDDENSDNGSVSTSESICKISHLQNDIIRAPIDFVPFRPVSGCIDASDYTVRCFVVRLRRGITVVKHSRKLPSKSHLRVLQIHPDGRSLTWSEKDDKQKPSRLHHKSKLPRMDLMECLEVRHALADDPKNEKYTGTEVLRTKCKPEEAFRSFSLIFKRRTVDFTAMTSDQCKFLMQGFSALCLRLQIAAMPEDKLKLCSVIIPSVNSSVSTDITDEFDEYENSVHQQNIFVRKKITNEKARSAQQTRMCLGIGPSSMSSCVQKKNSKSKLKLKRDIQLQELKNQKNSYLDLPMPTLIPELTQSSDLDIKNEEEEKLSEEYLGNSHSCSMWEFMCRS